MCPVIPPLLGLGTRPFPQKRLVLTEHTAAMPISTLVMTSADPSMEIVFVGDSVGQQSLDSGFAEPFIPNPETFPSTVVFPGVFILFREPSVNVGCLC